MLKSELIATLEAMPGDRIVVDVNGFEVMTAEDSAYYCEDHGENHDRVKLRFEGE